MKINRPLSPHLTVYAPQLTSTLSIFHRITGAFLASMLLLSILSVKVFDFSLSFYPVYWMVFHIVTGSALKSALLGASGLSLFALCYHISNGIRHILWDLGNNLELTKVVISAWVMLLCWLLLITVVGRNILRIFA